MNTSNSFNNYVNKNEATALKEMIFQRARARARVEAITEEVDTTYTNSVQQNVMNIARESFTADAKNPFSQIVEDDYNKSQTKEIELKEEIGFPMRKIEEKEAQSAYREKINTENIAQVRDNIMNTVSGEFAPQAKSFYGALNFLNSQASVSLLKKHAKGLDITA